MRWLDFFFAMRPLVLIPAWSFYILGFGAARRDAAFELEFPLLRLVLLSGILAGAYLINQVVDFESDRLNAKGFFLQRGIFTRRLYISVATALVLGAMGGAVGLREMPGLLGAAAGLGLAYSMPPLRLAARPGLDLLANAMGYGGLALLLGAGITRPDGIWGWRVAAGGLAVTAVFLHTTLLDLEGDRTTGKKTSGVVLGASRSRCLATMSAAASLALAWLGDAPVLSVACALLTLVATGAWLQPARLQSRFVCVAGAAIFALAAGLHAAVFLFVIGGLAIATRVYYRRRFSLAYPAL